MTLQTLQPCREILVAKQLLFQILDDASVTLVDVLSEVLIEHLPCNCKQLRIHSCCSPWYSFINSLKGIGFLRAWNNFMPAKQVLNAISVLRCSSLHLSSQWFISSLVGAIKSFFLLDAGGCSSFRVVMVTRGLHLVITAPPSSIESSLPLLISPSLLRVFFKPLKWASSPNSLSKPVVILLGVGSIREAKIMCFFNHGTVLRC